jgi:hypothetical protein
MSYVVRVVGPSGMVRYLTADQREVEYSQDAQQFVAAWEADRAADAFLEVARKCWPVPPIVGVIDPEEMP